MQIDAHRSPLAAMVLSSNGMYIATASEQGTIIRVHLVSDATKVKNHKFIYLELEQYLFPELEGVLQTDTVTGPSEEQRENRGRSVEREERHNGEGGREREREYMVR